MTATPATPCTTPCDGTGWTGHPRVLCTTHYEPMGSYFDLLHTE